MSVNYLFALHYVFCDKAHHSLDAKICTKLVNFRPKTSVIKKKQKKQKIIFEYTNDNDKFAVYLLSFGGIVNQSNDCSFSVNNNYFRMI